MKGPESRFGDCFSPLAEVVPAPVLESDFRGSSSSSAKVALPLTLESGLGDSPFSPAKAASVSSPVSWLVVESFGFRISVISTSAKSIKESDFRFLAFARSAEENDLRFLNSP